MSTKTAAPAGKTGGTCNSHTAIRNLESHERAGGFEQGGPAQQGKQSAQCNDDDRGLRRKQGGVVGAAASKTRVLLRARSGCWEPQPVAVA